MASGRSAPWQPPAGIAGEPHRSGHEQHPNERRVYEDRDGQRESELLELQNTGCEEASEYRHHDRGARGDLAGGVLDADDYRIGIALAAQPFFLYAAHQEQFIVHGKAK